MKRTSTTKKIISLILTVLMVCSCWVFSPIEADAATSTTYACDFPRSDDKISNTGFGVNGGLCVNSTEFGVHTLNTLYFLSNSYNRMAFCIQLGTSVDKGSTIETTDETEACNTLASRLLTSANASKVAMLNYGKSTLYEPYLNELLKEHLKNKAIKFTT